MGRAPMGEDVAQDAADPRGRPLVGLDSRRVVMGLDPNGRRDAVAHVDYASVLARANKDPWSLGG